MIRETLPKLPVYGPADWGFNVSVCIGVMCNSRKNLVLISDQRASFGDFSAESAVLKNTPMGKGAALYAGNDVDQAPIILESAFRKIVKAKQIEDPEFVAETIDAEYHDRLQYLIEKRVLRKHNFTAQSFLDSGKRKCTETIYNRLCERIAKIDLSLRFLYCGFNEYGTASILSCGGEEGIKDHSEFGCWAIGRGEPSAMASLAFRIKRQQFSVYHSVEEASYVALEAKFMAESATDVGTSTFFVVISADTKDTKFIHGKEINKIRSQWERKGAPRISQAVIDMIGESYSRPSVNEEIEAKPSAAQKSAGQP